MYQYDQIDQKIVDERVAQYSDQVRRRLSDELSEEEFRPLRLQNGLYLQRHAYMHRIAIPYGNLRSDQMRMLGTIAREHDRGYGTFRRGPTSSSTGSSSKRRRRSCASWHRCKCTAFKRQAIASAISPPINLQALRPMNSSIRVRGPKSCANGRH